MKTFALDAAMTAAAQLTEREGGGGGAGRVQSKRKSGVFSIFDMQATGCSVQQLRKRELVECFGYLEGKGLSEKEKERKKEKESRRALVQISTALPDCFKQTELLKKEGRGENEEEEEEEHHNWLSQASNSG